VATANLFPKIAITGGVGQQGQGLGVTPAINSLLWSAGPAISWSLLDFGTLDALVDLADLHTQELLMNYKKTALRAVQEVDTAASDYTAQQDRLRNLKEALTAGQRTLSVALERYDRGLTDSLNVDDAQRYVYELEELYVAARKTSAEQFVALYKAMGGGWEQYQDIPPIHTPLPAILAAGARLTAKDSRP
jgi:outer membrane protein TolC